MDNKETWRQTNTTTSDACHFNQCLVDEIKVIKKLMKEAGLNVMLIRNQG